MKKTIAILISLILNLCLSKLSFAQAEPVIFYLDVESGPAGVFVTLNGRGFSQSDTVRFADTVAAPLDASYPIWSDEPKPVSSRVTVRAPNLNDGTYQVSVQTAKGISNYLPFTARPGNLYYVSLTGSDTNNGSISSPWNTLNYAVRHVLDGDFIYVRAGTYKEVDPAEATRMIYWRTSYSQGKQGWPITLQAYPGEEVFLNGQGSNTSGNREIISFLTPYINVVGFKMGENWRASLHVFDQGTGIRIVNNEIFHNSTDPLGSGAIDSTTANNGMQVLGNFIHDVGTADSGSNKNHGMYIQGQNMLIAYNVVGDVIANDNFHADVGIQTYPRSAVQSGVVIKNNLVFGVNRGILMDAAPGPGFLIQNNIIRDCNWSGIWVRAGSAALIYNNTLVNNGYKGTGSDRNQILLSANGTTVIKDNILYSSYYSGMIEGVLGAEADYNLYYYTNGAITNGGGAHSIGKDPLFNNLANQDFHLREMSPAKDAGLTIAEVAKDYDGKTRPQGSGYDIGAYEYVSAITSIKGDVNLDNTVDVLDVQKLVNIILGQDIPTSPADVNQDGAIDVLDVQNVVNIILGT
jgi:parallel beta-helix repeat protein